MIALLSTPHMVADVMVFDMVMIATLSFVAGWLLSRLTDPPNDQWGAPR
jgi:hypothetical protein